MESKSLQRGMAAGKAAVLSAVALVVSVLVGFLLVGLLAASPAHAQTARIERDRDALTAYAQANTRQGPRTRIRVSPRCFYRLQPTTYPVPYDCEAPGPGFVRECTSWLKQEYRASGTVIVPEMRCWWVRG